MTTYSIKLFENPGSKEKTNGMTYHTMSKAAAIADKLFNTGLYYEVQVINNDNGQAWYTQKNQRPTTKESQTTDTDTIESIFADIDNKTVQNTIELYKEQYSAADQRHRETISAALDGYTKALEDLQIIRPDDFIIIRDYVQNEDD